MALLIAPNGVAVNASEQDTPILLAAGYAKADKQKEQQKPRTRKRTAKPKEQ